MTPLPLLGGNNGQASGINNRGQIAGAAETSMQDSCSIYFLQVEAVIWENGQVRELPPFPGDQDGFAGGINDKGQVAGVTGCVATNTVRAVLWPKGPNGGAIDLGSLGGTTNNIASAINNQSQLVGQSDLPGDNTHHGFLWQDGVMTDLGTLNGQPVSNAFGINNQGQVVGIFEDFAGDNTTGFLWQDGVMTDLNTLIPPGSPLFLKEPIGINDRGEIVGFGLDSSGNELAFLLAPCDKNHPGIEGCDYSKVDAPAAAVAQTTPAVRNPCSRTLPPSLMRRMNRFHFPGSAFGPRN